MKLMWPLKLAMLFLVLGTFKLFSQEGEAPLDFNGTNISDAVHLPTGDFNYSISLFTIPGATEGFPLTLNYSSGARLNQRASWVGLSWQLDPGRIDRDISQIPDDYDGQLITTVQQDPGGEQTVDGPGFFEQLFSGAFEKIRLGTEAAAYGNDQGISAAMGHLYSAAGALGALGVGSAGGGRSSTFNEETGKTEDFRGGGGGINPIALARAIIGPKINFSHLRSWDWDITQHITYKKFLFWDTNYPDRIRYKWYLSNARHEKSFGILYQSSMPVFPASPFDVANPKFENIALDQTPLHYTRISEDINDLGYGYDKDNFASDYFQPPAGDKKIYENNSPIYWATDFYRVNAPNLNGELKPVRFDNPSVATSFSSNTFYSGKVALYKYAIGRAQSGKVQFIMLNDRSNNYTYHKDSFNGDFGLIYTDAEIKLPAPYNIKPYTDYTIKALRLGKKAGSLGLQSDGLSSSKPADDSFNGDNILSKGNLVKWYTTGEINSEFAKSDGFIDSDGADREYRSSSGIGGFTIIDKRGYSYHFATPVFGHRGTVSLKVGNTTNTSAFESQVAISWLLTSITGPDFVDSGTRNGFIDEGDTGHYVKFEYGRYQMTVPDNNNLSRYTPDDITHDIELSSSNDLYYLNSISTPTHTALFVKGPRKDNFYSFSGTGFTSLFLEQIILLKNADVDYLKNVLKLSYNSGFSDYFLGSQDRVLKAEDIKPSIIKEFISANAIQRITFEYDYSLCQGMPSTSSAPLVGSQSGKLTLKTLNVYGKNDSRLVPGYSFSYSNNPNFNLNSWDAWGFYKHNTTPGIDNHKVDNGYDGLAWSLNQITTPIGGVIDITYERDKYSSVSGQLLENNLSEKWGGDLRVTDLKLKTENDVSHYKFNYSSKAGQTSGVATLEPIFCKGTKRGIQNIYDYPAPLVTYGRVERYRALGDEKIPDDVFVYNFHTADQQTVTVNKILDQNVVISDELVFSGATKFGAKLKQTAYNTFYRDSKIGLLSSIEKFDAKSKLLNLRNYKYEDSEIGTITQGLHLFDRTYNAYAIPPGDNGKSDNRISYRFINNVITYIPSRLASIETKNVKLGITQLEEYLHDDFYTGEPMKVLNSDGYGNSYVSETIPAYSIPDYSGMTASQIAGNVSGMGLKVNNPKNKNMLTQSVGSSTYKVNSNYKSNQTDANKLALVSASAQTWSDQSELMGVAGNNQVVTQPGIWRQKSSFSFVGGDQNIPFAVNGDGFVALPSFAPFTNWTTHAEQPGWQKNAEITKYDFNSHTIEAKDINNQFAATKFTYDHSQVLATAANAKYEELAYSGAEEPLQTDQFFNSSSFNFKAVGGGVYISGNATLSPSSHTGAFSVQANPGQKSFMYSFKPTNGTIYQVSTWISQNNAQIKYRLNNGADQIASAQPIKTAGTWNQLTATIPVSGMFSKLEVWCEANGTTTLFDDFRIHPYQAAMTSYVYNNWGELTHILDNNNLYTEYKYDGMGRLTETYKESFQANTQGRSKISEINYNYGWKNATPFKVTISTEVATNTSGVPQIGGSGVISPTVQVLQGGNATISATNRCDNLTTRFYADGKLLMNTYGSMVTLYDGAKAYIDGGVCKLTGVLGDHTVKAEFEGPGPAPLILHQADCEMDGECYTGMYILSTWSNECGIFVREPGLRIKSQLPDDIRNTVDDCTNSNNSGCSTRERR